MDGEQVSPGFPDAAPPAQLRLAVNWWWPVALAVAVAASYHELITWMAQQWWRDEYYGHGMIIPVVSAYLLWRERGRLAALPQRSDWRGLVVLSGALVLQAAGETLGVHFASGFALVATLWGLALWLWGPAVARAVLFPLAFLLFMVPLSRILVEKLALPMQLFSARGAGAVAGALLDGVKVTGTSIATPGYIFSVAIPCSGLKSLISMSALGALYAYLVEGPPLRRVLLFLAALPIALLANLLRIFATVVLGNTIGPAAAEGFFHTVSGIFVFLLALGGLFVLGGALGCQKLRDDI
jgi:exosortase